MAPPRSVAAQHKGKLERDDPTLLPSDDDDDSDFHLSDGGDGGSDSGDDSDDGDDGPQKKRAKVEEPEKPAFVLHDLWASFNDGLDDPYAASSSSTAAQPAAGASSSSTTAKSVTADAKGKGKGAEEDMIEIEVEYGFAGETIKQKKVVPRSSDEAQAYLATHPLRSTTTSSSSAPPAASSAAAAAPAAPAPSDPTTSSLDALFGPSSASDSPAPATSSASPAPTAPAPAARPPPKRKAGGGLAGMAASLGVGKKPAKLNTLEKSKLDWNNYVSTQEGLSDTLTHARKDGYLDRRDFLDRVDGAKERQWEEAKGRRK
ncbi:hypothetical protein JCM10449v2_004515 [Rhodotorula kratochvilovae]